MLITRLLLSIPLSVPFMTLGSRLYLTGLLLPHWRGRWTVQLTTGYSLIIQLLSDKGVNQEKPVFGLAPHFFFMNLCLVHKQSCMARKKHRRVWHLTERIEWFIEGQAFMRSAPCPPPYPPLSRQQELPFFLGLPVCRRSSLQMGEGGRGESHDRKKAWSSINCSILSGTYKYGTGTYSRYL